MKRIPILFLTILSWILTVLFTGHIWASDKPVIYIEGTRPLLITSVAISLDKNYIVSGSILDNAIRLWEVCTGKEIRILRGHTDSVNSVSISGDGKTIASGSSDKTIRLWEVDTGKEIRTLKGHTGAVTSVSISGDGKTIVSGSRGYSLRLWDADSGKKIRTFSRHPYSVTSVSISGNGKTIVSAGSRDNTIRLWDANSDNGIRTFIGHTDAVTSVSINDDGKIVASGSRDKTVRLWNVKSGKIIRTFVGHTQSVTSVSISGDGKTIVSGSDDGTIRSWAVNSIKELQIYKGLHNSILSVSISGDSKVIISGSARGGVKIWGAQEGTLFASLVPFPDGQWVTYTPDNYFISSIDADQHINFQINEEIYEFSTYSAIYRNAKIVAQRLRPIITNRTSENDTSQTIYDNSQAKTSLTQIVKWVKSKLGETRSWAVLIAIKDYSMKRNGFKPLPYAIRDAEAVKKYLINILQFKDENIFTLYDSEATRAGIQKMLGEVMPRKVKSGDRVLVYFSGHGGREIIEAENGGTETVSYLIPKDCIGDSLFSTAISIDLVNDFSRRISANQALFIIDACFSGNTDQIYKSGPYKKETKQEIKNLIRKKGRHVITAGSVDEEAVMGDKWGRLSIYTYYLLRGLRGKADYNKNMVITLDELQVYLKSTVSKEVSLSPQKFTLKNSRGGEFVFYIEGEN